MPDNTFCAVCRKRLRKRKPSRGAPVRYCDVEHPERKTDQRCGCFLRAVHFLPRSPVTSAQKETWIAVLRDVIRDIRAQPVTDSGAATVDEYDPAAAARRIPDG